jgi:hypothetical protein
MIGEVWLGEVWLRADGAGGCGFAECGGMAKVLASAALRRIAERDVLADIAFPVEQQHLGVPNLGAEEGDDHGGGGLVLSVLGGGEPSRRLGQLRSWVEHLELFAAVFWRGGGGDPVHDVSSPLLADVGRNGVDLGQGIANDTEERLVVVSGAGGEHDGVRSGDVGGVERRDSDVRVSQQSSVDRVEGDVSCFRSVVGRLSKLDNDTAFAGREGLLPSLGLPRNDGVPCRTDVLGSGSSGGFRGGGSRQTSQP